MLLLSNSPPLVNPATLRDAAKTLLELYPSPQISLQREWDVWATHRLDYKQEAAKLSFGNSRKCLIDHSTLQLPVLVVIRLLLGPQSLLKIRFVPHLFFKILWCASTGVIFIQIIITSFSCGWMPETQHLFQTSIVKSRIDIINSISTVFHHRRALKFNWRICESLLRVHLAHYRCLNISTQVLFHENATLIRTLVVHSQCSSSKLQFHSTHPQILKSGLHNESPLPA